MYDFTHAASRKESNAEKYTLAKQLFGTTEIIPAWVADMDIDTPDCVIQAVQKRLQHPVIGYEEMPQSAYEAQVRWLQQRHGVVFQAEDIFYSHSVVASMAATIEACTRKGDEVIVQTPVYPPFFHMVKNLGRKLIRNPLKRYKDGSYGFDSEDLQAKITPKTKLFLLCSPHNPVGRVWKREELEEIERICYKNNIVVCS